MKKFFTIVVLICCMMFLGGCGAPAFQVQQNSDGSIEELFQIPYSQGEMSEKGATEEQIKNVFTDVSNTFINNFYEPQRLAYILRVNALNVTDEQKNALFQDILFTYPVFTTGEYINFTLKYKSVTSYYLFKGVTQEMLDNDKPTIIDNFFTYKKLNTSTNVFGQIIKDDTKTISDFLMQISDEILIRNLGQDIASQISRPQYFVYSYGTTTSRLHSDADRVVSEDGHYYHLWKIVPDGIGREVSTWTIHANKPVWYGMILAVVVLAVGTMFLVDYLKKKKIKETVVEK